MWGVIWPHMESSPSYRTHIRAVCIKNPLLLFLALAFLERHEIKMTVMTHCFDTCCRNHVMKFLCRASKCTYTRIFLMSLLCFITSWQACWLPGRSRPLKGCFPLRLYLCRLGCIKQPLQSHAVNWAPVGVCNILLVKGFEYLVVKLGAQSALIQTSDFNLAFL